MADIYFSYIHATKGYVVQATSSSTTTLGGLTMGGNIGMGSNKLTSLSAASGSGEALVYGQASASLAGLTMSGNIAMGNYTISGLSEPDAADKVATKGYVDRLVVTGGRIKEAVLDAIQLDNTDGINAAEVVYFTEQPSHTTPDTVIFKNGTLTRTYTFVENIGAESAATDVSKQTSAVTAMQRLATRMTADAGNTQWDIVFRATGMERINADGALLVYEKESASGASASRIYGDWTGHQTGLKVVEFASGAGPTVSTEYSAIAGATAAASDPGAGRFGFRRVASALTDCEIHCALNTDVLYAWDSDTAVWVTMSGSGVVPEATSASGGATKGRLTVDSDYGLVLNSGVLTINLATDPGLQFVTDGSVKKLLAKVNTNAGLQLTSSGVEVKVDGTSAQFSSGTIFSLDATAINCSASVTKGYPLYVSGNDTVAHADTTDTNNKANVVGLAYASQGTVGQPVKVVRSGVITAVLSSTAGKEQWLAAGGGLTDTMPAAGNRLIRVGFALNAADLSVQIQDYGYRPS